MKTKLLRKVRKRYSIEYFPHGLTYYDNFIPGPVITLFDNNRYWREKIIKCTPDTKEDKYKELHSILLSWVLCDYKGYGTRRNKKSQKSIKLWYNESN